MGKRKKSGTAYLLIRRIFNKKSYHRYHSYKSKIKAKNIARKIREKGKSVRIFTSKGEKYEYTIYVRKKRTLKGWIKQ